MNIGKAVCAFTSLRMDAADTAKWVTDHAVENKVVIFSRSTCPYCVRAIEALRGLVPNDVVSTSVTFAKVAQNVVNLDNNPDYKTIMAYFKEATGAATVPRVYIGGKFYGDCSKVMATKESGDLQETLKGAGCDL
ncbi:hypothetical protein BgAZ_401910 [Babesia gibsoni]|uniref:Glutaredoxin domain-containing protein n=1 Tax=Babesia gibsoni TaxID=33632 RepID=A0AAD8LN16_BABGI|nr:hypothetical protein BgAZ_401910 [Babesia gibsoni]